jgi:hypothetical protein
MIKKRLRRNRYFSIHTEQLDYQHKSGNINEKINNKQTLLDLQFSQLFSSGIWWCVVPWKSTFWWNISPQYCQLLQEDHWPSLQKVEGPQQVHGAQDCSSHEEIIFWRGLPTTSTTRFKASAIPQAPKIHKQEVPLSPTVSTAGALTTSGKPIQPSYFKLSASYEELAWLCLPPSQTTKHDGQLWCCVTLHQSA